MAAVVFPLYRPMRARDPHETRAQTALELLFDLAFRRPPDSLLPNWRRSSTQPGGPKRDWVSPWCFSPSGGRG